MTRRSLLADCQGATIIEFAIVAPVLVLLLMGLGDLSYGIYAQAILNGAVQKAGRDSSIQDASSATIDAAVISMVGSIMKGPTQSCAAGAASTPIWCSTRTSYYNFSAIAKPEPFQDNNGNGRLDPGECFTDLNGNGVWDASNAGVSGQGGANDVTLYKMTITYPRIFPLAGLLGWPQTQTISSSTLLKNQPYATQATPVCK